LTATDAIGLSNADAIGLSNALPNLFRAAAYFSLDGS
jgi:hypothetical protein